MLDEAIPVTRVNSSWFWMGSYRAKAFCILYSLLHSEFGIAGVSQKLLTIGQSGARFW